MTTLTINEIEARASAVESGLRLAAVHMSRSAALVKSAANLCIGHHHFRKLTTLLNESMNDLGPSQLTELADILDTTTVYAKRLRDRDVSRFHMLERAMIDSFIGFLDQVEALAIRLRKEAQVRMETNPPMDATLFASSRVASAFMRPVAIDKTEREPDPMYGF